MSDMPTWTGLSGRKVDTGSATIILEQYLVMVQEHVKYLDSVVDSKVKSLKEAKEDAHEAREKLEYWKAVVAVTREVDRRLEAGEEVQVADGGE